MLSRQRACRCATRISQTFERSAADNPRRGPPECARRGLGRCRRLSLRLSARVSALRVALAGPLAQRSARCVSGCAWRGADLSAALFPIIALPGSEIAPPLALQIRRCSLGCNGSLLGQTCHARLWPAGPLMTLSGHHLCIATTQDKVDLQGDEGAF